MGQTGRDGSSFHWFPPQMAIIAISRPGQSQEPRNPSWSPTCGAGGDLTPCVTMLVPKGTFYFVIHWDTYMFAMVPCNWLCEILCFVKHTKSNRVLGNTKGGRRLLSTCVNTTLMETVKPYCTHICGTRPKVMVLGNLGADSSFRSQIVADICFE